MIDLYSPRGEMELLILRSILEDAGIPFFVRNDTFGSLYPGRYSEAYNRKTVCVPEAALEEARGLVREFLERTGAPVPPEPLDEGPLHRLALAVHAALGRWAGRWSRRFPALRRLEQRPSPEELRSRFRLIRNERPTPTTTPPDRHRRPPLRPV